MKASWRILVAALAILGGQAIAAPVAAGLLGQIPLSFEPAEPGQPPSYIAAGSEYSLLVSVDGIEFRSHQGSSRLVAEGASRNSRLEPLDPLPVRSSYYIGDDPARWRINVPNYRRIRVRNLYPGIDVIYYGNWRRLEYDFIVTPGADPRRIEWRLSGDHALRLSPEGDLLIPHDGGHFVHRRPIAYQLSPQGRQAIPARFVLRSRRRVGFAVGGYDRTRTLYIDPVVSYSSYVTDPADQALRAIAIDPEGNIIVAGQTRYSTVASGVNSDGFVLKLNPTATSQLGRMVLGGPSTDQAQAIAVDAAGDIYVTGLAFSGFPTTAGAFRTSNAGAGDAFIAKINGRTMSLVFSTFLGGSGGESGGAIGVDREGNVWVSGGTGSNNFPTVNPIQASRKPGTCGLTLLSFPCSDLFFSKLNPSGSALLFSTYFGTSGVSPPTRGVLYGNDTTYDLVVDGSGSVIATGSADGEDFPVTPGALNAGPNNTGNVFVVKLSSSGSLDFAARIGGSHNSELGGGIALDPAGNIYVAGVTYSEDFPTTPGVVQPSSRGNGEVFVLKMDPAGRQLLFSTFLGGSREEQSGIGLRTGIAIDPAGNIWLSPSTPSPDFPVTADATQRNHGGERDVAVVKLDPSGSSILFSTFLGGSRNEEAGALRVAPNGDVLVVGQTSSTNFPTTANALRGSVQTAGNGFLTIFSEAGAQPPAPPPQPGPAPSSGYLPVAPGMEWEYRVTFPETAQVPYLPAHEEPAGLVCTSVTCGSGRWNAGQIQFTMTVNEQVSSTSGDSWRVTLPETGRRFFFFITSADLRTELRVRTVDGRPQLDIVGRLDIFRLARPLARPTPAEMTQTQTVTVPAGVFRDVVKTTITLTGDGQHVDRSTYTTDVFLAPGVGIIKAEMRNAAGRVLYTQELTRTNAGSGSPAPPPAARLSVLSAASFTGSPFAPESLVAAFGERLATATTLAPGTPLPLELEGTTVVIIDASGRQHPAQLIFVSARQVNFVVPATVAPGDVTIRITSGDGAVSEGAARVEPVAPALFSANADGRGVAAGYIVRARADGSQSSEFLFRDDPAQGRRVANPIDLGPETDQVVLVLFGSGIRGRGSLDGVRVEIGGRSLTAQYAGPQGEFAGLDQINVALMRDLGGAGEVNIAVTVDGRRANVVTMVIGGAAAGPPPAITSVRPVSAVVGGSPAQVAITGSNLARVTAVSLAPPDGITVANLQASGDRITASVSVAPGATPGTRRLSVSAGAASSNALNFAIYDPRTARVPVISDLAIPASSVANGQLDFSITLRFTDNDGDILRGPDIDSSAKFRFRFTRGGQTCIWRLTPTSALDRPGETAGTVNSRHLVAPLGPGERGSLAVSLLDAAGNESNALTIPEITWACPP